MNNIIYIAPVFLVVICNTLYHLISKNTSTELNPFAALLITYGVAFLGSAILFVLTKKDTCMAALSELKISNFLMGLVIIGIEGGYLMMYQKGWELSKASLVSNICISIILFLIGTLAFQEEFSLRKIIGLFICIIGIFIINMN